MTCTRCHRRTVHPGLVVCAACAEDLVGRKGASK